MPTELLHRTKRIPLSYIELNRKCGSPELVEDREVGWVPAPKCGGEDYAYNFVRTLPGQEGSVPLHLHKVG